MPAYKATVKRCSKGYPVMKAGPLRDVRIHREIAAAMLKRPLHKDEHVHHKDGNVLNFRWTNLLVLDERTHGAVSSRQYWYLKQKLGVEEAAWKAFFDVTGETYVEYESRQQLESTIFDTALM